jgi:hypothetical protein
MELFLLLALGAGAFYLISSRSAPAETPKEGDPSKGKGLAEKECPYGVDLPVEKLPDGLQNSIKAAIAMGDVENLEDLAVSMDKLCQGVAAKLLRDKAAEIKSKVPEKKGTGAIIKECYGVPDRPVNELPVELRNAVLAALTTESDPDKLEELAAAMDKICQGVAAKALRDKAAALKKLGAPSGWMTPEPTPGTTVPPSTLPGLPNLSPELDPTTMSLPGLPASWEPKGLPSMPGVQWWSGPFSPSGGDSLYGLAKTITGDGSRYVELINVNPEKDTVGDPSKPYSTGYSFANLSEGEQIRIPKSWNVFLSDFGYVL